MTEKDIQRIHMEKKSFVENDLQGIILKIDPGIKEIKYENTASGEEYVKIQSHNSECITTVCVTGDSYLAIVKSVLQKFTY